MRLGIRGKQIAGVTAIVGVAVVVLSALYVMRLANVVLYESHSRAQLLANAILHHAAAVLRASSADSDPYEALRNDSGMRSILESSIYGGGVVGAAILDTAGVVVAHWDPEQVGTRPPERADLGRLVEESSLNQLRAIYSAQGRTLEIRQQMILATPEGDEAFGSIHVGVSTLLLRDELNAWLQPAVVTAVGALIIAVFVAALLSQLLLRPIHVIRSGLTRLGKGEFGVTLDLPPGDEFGELGTFFNTVSAQLSADRTLLAGQKAHLQSAVEHLEDAVALFNPAGELLFANPAMQRMLPPNAIGRAMHGLLPVAHPYRALVEETLMSRSSRGPIHIQAAEVSDASGAGESDPAPGRSPARVPHVADTLAMTHAIAGTGGDLMGILLVSRNLAYLSRMQSTLAYSRKLVELGRLTAGIAHEVKNPLNAMMIHLELLRTKIRNGVMDVRQPEPVAAGGMLGLAGARAAALPPEVQSALSHVEIIESEIRRLDEVVQGFLKFARPEDLRLQPVCVSTLVDEIVQVVQVEGQQRDVRILKECPPGVPSVNGDAAMLRQALLNLAINACQAMPHGGTLRLACQPAAKDRVEIRIEDTGIGIPPENLGRIFDLYFTTKDDGTGLGLSMVYRIVQLHDGEIEVESTPGRGTTFRVLLPRASQL
jgi:signal transduction histidine kinase